VNDEAKLKALNEARQRRGEPPLSALPRLPFCSFCGKTRDEVRALVAGDAAFICDQCVAGAARQMREGS
jgi:ClpX C4-type zinc finger